MPIAININNVCKNCISLEQDESEIKESDVVGIEISL